LFFFSHSFFHEDDEKEHTKVKELGRLFLEKPDQNPKAMYPKESAGMNL
jgi:hypothetical protein